MAYRIGYTSLSTITDTQTIGYTNSVNVTGTTTATQQWVAASSTSTTFLLGAGVWTLSATLNTKTDGGNTTFIIANSSSNQSIGSIFFSSGPSYATMAVANILTYTNLTLQAAGTDYTTYSSWFPVAGTTSRANSVSASPQNCSVTLLVKSNTYFSAISNVNTSGTNYYLTFSYTRIA